MKKPRKPNKPLDPIKQFNGWMRNTLRRAFFRYWERTKALQAARVDRGLYMCATCKKVDKILGHRIDHIDPVVDPKVGFVNWDVYIARLFCPASNLQLLCGACHDLKTDKERQERKLAKTGQFTETFASKRLLQLKDNCTKSKRPVIATCVANGEIKRFDCIQDAGDVLGLQKGNISRTCRKVDNRTQVGGWEFKYGL